jgi:hypothetical protein
MTRMTEPRLSADLEPRLRDHAEAACRDTLHRIFAAAAGRAAAEEPGSPFRLPAVLRSADIRVSPAVWPSTRREEIDP